ncbi:hypothetical protein, partial [Geobacillus sp. BMUD]
ALLSVVVVSVTLFYQKKGRFFYIWGKKVGADPKTHSRFGSAPCFLFTEYDSRKENRVRTIVFGEVKWKVGRMENERKLQRKSKRGRYLQK